MDFEEGSDPFGASGNGGMDAGADFDDGAEPDLGGSAEEGGLDLDGDDGAEPDLGGEDSADPFGEGGNDAAYEPPGGGGDTPAASGSGDDDAFAGADASGPLREWQARFEEQMAQKDAEEREAQAARRAKAKDDMASWISERQAVLDTRKSTNREHDEARQEELDAALEGASWDRVYQMADTEVEAAKPKADEEEESDAAPQKKTLDASRMRDILIQLKAHGLPDPVAA